MKKIQNINFLISIIFLINCRVEGLPFVTYDDSQINSTTLILDDYSPFHNWTK